MRCIAVTAPRSVSETGLFTWTTRRTSPSKAMREHEPLDPAGQALGDAFGAPSSTTRTKLGDGCVLGAAVSSASAWPTVSLPPGLLSSWPASMRDETFERQYARHAPALLGFLTYRLGDRALAEDLMADTFEQVLRARRRFDPRRGSERAWIYTIALNRVRDVTRRRAVETRALEHVASATLAASPSSEERVANRELVLQGLEVLSDEEREAIALRFGAELTVPEISRLLGQPLTTIEGRVYRALRKLREALE